MNKAIFFKVLLCTLSFGGALYAYVQKQNDITCLRIELPTLYEEVKFLEEENTRLSLEIERFENPKHLMRLANRPEFSHLKHPVIDEVLVIKDGGTIDLEKVPMYEEKTKTLLGLPSVVIGAR